MRRLVVFSHKLFRQTTLGLQTTGGFTIQMDALAPYFEQLTLCVPVRSEPDFSGVSPTSANLFFHPLPPTQGRLEFLQAIPRMHQQIQSALDQADLALVLLPGYVGFLASVICQRRSFPLFHWVVGDWSATIIQNRQYNLSKAIAARFIAPLTDRFMKRLIRDVLTFYNGQILYEPRKPYHYIRISSSIHASDIIPTSHQSQLPFNFLFVGRLSPEKGLTDLIEATSWLVSKGEDVQLNIVGTGHLASVLQEQTKRLAISERVHFHGYLPLGDALFDLYRACDVLVLPSREDLQPKVLLEGMSQGLPIIATRVGGIPAIITDTVNGLLISPGQPAEIAEACQRLLADKALRLRLIHHGIQFARAHTVETETKSMMTLVNAYFDRQP